MTYREYLVSEISHFRYALFKIRDRKEPDVQQQIQWAEKKLAEFERESLILDLAGIE
jgi:hypothetical protein